MPAPRNKSPESPNVSYKDCWAKTTADGQPGISVYDHCLNVGCVAEELLSLMPEQLRQELPSGIVTLAALHDIGKVSPGFQQKCPVWVSIHPLPHSIHETDHAKVSQFTVREMLGKSNLEQWSIIVGAHHGQLKGRLSCEPWEEERRKLAKELIGHFGSLPMSPVIEAMLWWTAGLITVSDWIGSDERYFPQTVRESIDEKRQEARVALGKIGWNGVAVHKALKFTQLFPFLEAANSLQSAVQAAVAQPGIYVVEGPMGYGKTEAALAAAYRLIEKDEARGLFFALPTQVTSNRIHERVQHFLDGVLKDAKLVQLAHSASWLVELALPLQFRPSSKDSEAYKYSRTDRSWFASSKRALLASFGVGTVDQALLGIVAANHFFVRQFGLAGKVVVLDEVHTYDLYTSTLIDTLVKRLRELDCTVIVLSATLTEQRRRELLGLPDGKPLSAKYPLVSGVTDRLAEFPCSAPRPKEVFIRHVEGAVSVEDVMDRARNGECVLWIRNTVNDAQETWGALKSANQEGGPPIALLHSRFPFFRREELESDWMTRLGKSSVTRPNGCVLVSTQIAEQSVDIDADLLITDLAPTDMLLQRLGRLWRHERHERSLQPSVRPEVWIQMPVGCDEFSSISEVELCSRLGRSSRVYAPYVLLRSMQQWRSRSRVLLPDDIRSILEATYADSVSAEPPAWKKLREYLEKRKAEMARKAISATTIFSNPALPDEEGVQTRYNTHPSAQLLMARHIHRDGSSIRLDMINGDSAVVNDYEWSFEAAKAIYRNLTRVPRWAVAAFLSGAPGWLTNHVHQATAIGLLDDDGRVLALDGETSMRLSYRPDEGIRIRLDHIQQPQEDDDEYFD